LTVPGVATLLFGCELEALRLGGGAVGVNAGHLDGGFGGDSPCSTLALAAA
jgi:hypothetical protein